MKNMISITNITLSGLLLVSVCNLYSAHLSERKQHVYAEMTVLATTDAADARMQAQALQRSGHTAVASAASSRDEARAIQDAVLALEQICVDDVDDAAVVDADECVVLDATSVLRRSPVAHRIVAASAATSTARAAGDKDIQDAVLATPLVCVDDSDHDASLAEVCDGHGRPAKKARRK